MILSKLRGFVCVLSIFIKIFVGTLINEYERKKLTFWYFLIN